MKAELADPDTRRPRRARVGAGPGHLVLIALFLAGPSACLDTQDPDPPAEARITISGTSPDSLRLITSTDFFEQIVGDSEIQAVLVQADTLAVLPPFETQVSLRSVGEVFVRVSQEGTTPSNVTVQVFLDGELEYDRTATLSQGGALEYRYLGR